MASQVNTESSNAPEKFSYQLVSTKISGFNQNGRNVRRNRGNDVKLPDLVKPRSPPRSEDRGIYTDKDRGLVEASVSIKSAKSIFVVRQFGAESNISLYRMILKEEFPLDLSVRRSLDASSPVRTQENVTPAPSKSKGSVTTAAAVINSEQEFAKYENGSSSAHDSSGSTATTVTMQTVLVNPGIVESSDGAEVKLLPAFNSPVPQTGASSERYILKSNALDLAKSPDVVTDVRAALAGSTGDQHHSCNPNIEVNVNPSDTPEVRMEIETSDWQHPGKGRLEKCAIPEVHVGIIPAKTVKTESTVYNSRERSKRTIRVPARLSGIYVHAQGVLRKVKSPVNSDPKMPVLKSALSSPRKKIPIKSKGGPGLRNGKNMQKSLL
ncbi:unnamed protein product [Allacma fusca]|uniref:Uncharacterized protein n=1 Tax=Allacma fusca TaxID=39272 RepID=A0A8J2JU23_9HEXA|nr:unnamed protein product [Allacma fusca]